jgi:predicted nucleotidyltransferase
MPNEAPVTASRSGSKLSAMPTPEDHIAGLTKLIAAHDGVKRVILFGSRARGYAGERSDIDLAVDVTDECDWWALEEAVEDYPTLLKIDLVRLSRSGADLAHAISETGRVLYEAP